MRCSWCGSKNLSIERRMDGNCMCLDCGFTEKRKSEDYVVTTILELRDYKKCRCSVCGIIKECTPEFNFCSNPESINKLLCPNCFKEYYQSKK